MLTYFTVAISNIRTRLDRLRGDDSGYTTETVVVTALLVAAALAVLAILVAAITRKASEIGNLM